MQPSMSSLTHLRAEALAARAANDPNRAVVLWRALLDAAPDDWALALELKHDLKAGWHYPDSDARFRRAARRLPDEAWLEHYAGLYAFHGSDLDAIDARARALRLRWPENSRLEAILGDVARQRRDWPEAERAFTAAMRLDPADTECGHRARSAHLYARLAARPWPDAGPAYAIAVVNLDRNAERMVEIDRQFAGSAPPRRRIPAVEGSRLPGAAVRLLTGVETAPRGTLGCFLSHAAAWEALLASGDEAALIVEDDVIPLLDLPARLGGLNLPEAWDIVFVNDRLEPLRDPDQAQDFTTQTLAATMVAFHPEDNAPGADGYLLSPVGARKLLDWVAADGMADDVDWRMLAYALSPAAIAAIPAHSHARRELGRLGGGVPRVERLTAHVLHPALIRTVGVSSDREDENRMHPG
jgi:GR25 family glycosyltransferase involved in LPS biosynthesis